MAIGLRYASLTSISDVSTVDTDELYTANERFGTPVDRDYDDLGPLLADREDVPNDCAAQSVHDTESTVTGELQDSTAEFDAVHHDDLIQSCERAESSVIRKRDSIVKTAPLQDENPKDQVAKEEANFSKPVRVKKLNSEPPPSKQVRKQRPSALPLDGRPPEAPRRSTRMSRDRATTLVVPLSALSSDSAAVIRHITNLREREVTPQRFQSSLPRSNSLQSPSRSSLFITVSACKDQLASYQPSQSVTVLKFDCTEKKSEKVTPTPTASRPHELPATERPESFVLRVDAQRQSQAAEDDAVESVANGTLSMANERETERCETITKIRYPRATRTILVSKPPLAPPVSFTAASTSPIAKFARVSTKPPLPVPPSNARTSAPCTICSCGHKFVSTERVQSALDTRRRVDELDKRQLFQRDVMTTSDSALLGEFRNEFATNHSSNTPIRVDSAATVANEDPYVARARWQLSAELALLEESARLLDSLVNRSQRANTWSDITSLLPEATLQKRYDSLASSSNGAFSNYVHEPDRVKRNEREKTPRRSSANCNSGMYLSPQTSSSQTRNGYPIQCSASLSRFDFLSKDGSAGSPWSGSRNASQVEMSRTSSENGNFSAQITHCRPLSSRTFSNALTTSLRPSHCEPAEPPPATDADRRVGRQEQERLDGQRSNGTASDYFGRFARYFDGERRGSFADTAVAASELDYPEAFSPSSTPAQSQTALSTSNSFVLEKSNALGFGALVSLTPQQRQWFGKVTSD